MQGLQKKVAHDGAYVVFFKDDDGILHNQYVGHAKDEKDAVRIGAKYGYKENQVYKIEKL